MLNHAFSNFLVMNVMLMKAKNTRGHCNEAGNSKMEFSVFHPKINAEILDNIEPVYIQGNCNFVILKF